MTITCIEFNASDLNRNPAKVFNAAKNHPVRLKRRGGPDMILVSKKELRAQAEAFETAALLLPALLAPKGYRLENIRLAFPWMAELDEALEKDCADQILAGMKDFFISATALPFTSVVHHWKNRAQHSAKDSSSLPRSRVESVSTHENPKH